MGLLNLFKKSKNRHVFTEDDRIRSSATKKMNAQLKQLEDQINFQAKINQLTQLKRLVSEEAADIAGVANDGDMGDAVEEKMMELLMGVISKNKTPVEQHGVQTQLIAPEQSQLTDEQILGLIDEMPRTMVKRAKKMDPETVKVLVRAQYPNLTEATLNRGLELLAQ